MSTEEEKPLFLRPPDPENSGNPSAPGPQFETLKAQVPSTWKKEPGVTWGDKFLRQDKALSERHKEFARLVALGHRNKEICEKLGFTQARVSVLRSNTRIKEEIERYRDKLFAVDTETRLKDLAPEALRAMEEILINPNLDPKDKESAAKWVIEKVSGKATQQVDVKGNVTIGVFMDKLDRLKEANKPLDKPVELPEPDSEPIDIEPVESTLDPIADWVDKEL